MRPPRRLAPGELDDPGVRYIREHPAEAVQRACDAIDALPDVHVPDHLTWSETIAALPEPGATLDKRAYKLVQVIDGLLEYIAERRC